MKLVSMIDFVLSLDAKEDPKANVTKSANYANFLKQPLKLGMFVPCDEEGNVLEEPRIEDYIFDDLLEFPGNPKEYDTEEFEKELHNYYEAKNRIIFSGFVYEGEFAAVHEKYGRILFSDNGMSINWFYKKFKTIEDLTPLGLEFKSEVLKKLK